jgi:cardiolipin synthase
MIRFVPGNCVTLLESGAEYFPALEAAIDGAQREVFLESYIYENDETGRRIGAALKRAAARGVRVQVLLDGFGSKTLPAMVVEDLRAAGVRLLFFRPEIAPWRLRRYRLRRLHRKLAVIDARIAFVGGINVIDDMDTPNQKPPRYDYAVAVEGPLLADIYHSARRLWSLVSWRQLAPWVKKTRRERRQAKLPLQFPPCGDVRAAFVVRDNIRHRRDIEDAYLEAISKARREIVIANAYFLPGRRFRQALVRAAARGVRVVLLLQGRVEYRLLHYATRALYRFFLEAGVEIHEYHRSFLHAKVAVIDRRWATVGSSNIDPFSLLVAREANVVVDDRGFAATLRESLERAMTDGGEKIHLDRWNGQPLYQRFLSWSAYGLVRLLVGMAGYARRYEEE